MNMKAQLKALLLRSAVHPLSPEYKSSIKKQIAPAGESSASKVVIDFSSPNIAKPFHFGHLKSTLLGNYLANLYEYLDNQVVRLNYIGDWGTQYGLLNLGLERNEFSDDLNLDSCPQAVLRHLVDIYVRSNELGRSDENFFREAKLKFNDIEHDPERLARWQKIRDISLNELISSYSKIGINFDKFEFESSYAEAAKELVTTMDSFGFVERLQDGAVVANVEKNNKIFQIPVLRSDGTSLYLTRDVAAAISRKEEYNFDQLLYLVGADQERHFHCLGQIIKYMDYDWHKSLIHIKLGKVLGMSTRGGKFVLLSDIVERTTEQYIESTKKVVTSKVKTEGDIELVGRHLALSALFIYDLRNPRTRHYEFDWDEVMRPSDRSGINLQTTHARLSSLMDKAKTEGLRPATTEEFTTDAICCDEAMSLLSTMVELDTQLCRSYSAKDASALVGHAASLSKAINRARRSDKLWITGERDHQLSNTRLAMFKYAQDQLGFIMKLVGLRPLDRV